MTSRKAVRVSSFFFIKNPPPTETSPLPQPAPLPLSPPPQRRPVVLQQRADGPRAFVLGDPTVGQAFGHLHGVPDAFIREPVAEAPAAGAGEQAQLAFARPFAGEGEQQFGVTAPQPFDL